jgi:hypothetical protein
MSKARAPKRKEEYVPPDEIKEFCNEILEAGMYLASVSSVGFPDAESVSNAIAGVLSVVKRYKLVGRWVTSVMTKEIRNVSIFVFSLLINIMHNF